MACAGANIVSISVMASAGADIVSFSVIASAGADIVPFSVIASAGAIVVKGKVQICSVAISGIRPISFAEIATLHSRDISLTAWIGKSDGWKDLFSPFVRREGKASLSITPPYQVSLDFQLLISYFLVGGDERAGSEMML